MSARGPLGGALVALALALAGVVAPAPAAPRPAQAVPLAGLDLIELQICYTTVLARYFEPVAPRTLVDGARTGIASELVARGIDGTLPYTPARVSFGEGGDLIDGLLLRTLARYGKRVDPHRLVAAAIAGELAALRDPYSVLFRPQQFATFGAYLGSGNFGGIGAMLSFDPKTGRAPIERVLPGGAAAAAGLAAGDALVAVDGKPVAALGATGLLGALRGAIGTRVRIDVVRGGAAQSYLLVRAAVHDPDVRTALVGTVGVLGLSRFGERAGADVADAVESLRSAGATAFVLDLRGDGGGYGEEATAVASVFLPAGVVYTTRDRDGTTVVSRASGTAHFHAPLVVLVDRETASAAEIVAAAVQDRHAGTIVGERTFGKGRVQSVYPLPDGSAVKLTTATYRTPNGRDLDGVGVAPDVPVAEPIDAVRDDPARDPQLARAVVVAAAPR